ncbi:MAG: serine/threonine protein kinase [Candidatus Marinimicrobia bacterium]|nr:serine/threonine protein kinase [Candidatus Neomarinimicrobiota bacterium]
MNPTKEATQPVELLETRTVAVGVDPADVPAPVGPAAAPVLPPARNLWQLQLNFENLIRERAIHYPVAYRLVRELGRGRQGIVFLGLRYGARGCVTRHAIKIFDPSIYAGVEQYWTDMGRIASQTSLLQTVNSPNLVSRDAYEEVNGIGYMQMEVVDGADLHYLLQGEHLDTAKNHSTYQEWAHFTDVIFRVEPQGVSIQPGVALYIMRQILRGLETLHELGFLHGDIKPANIMLNGLGYVKLVDYGRATRINERSGILFGTPLYMAPEQHRRRPSLIPADIYSVGLVGIEMLRGRRLIDPAGMTEQDLLDFKMDLPRTLPDLLPEHVRQNSQFLELLAKFVDPDPRRRYQWTGDADAGSSGLRIVHQQLAQIGRDAEYGRELQAYLVKIRDSQLRSDLIETPGH